MTPEIRSERGFTLMELLVASTLTIVVLGGAVALTSQIQSGYRRQIEDSVGEQEARYALEWIGRYLRAAGNHPFTTPASACSGVLTTFVAITKDPNGDGVDNDINIQSDTNPPDGLIGGAAGTCTQSNEHVTIRFDSTNRTITFQDNGVGTSVTTRTDTVINDLQFVYLDSTGAVTTTAANAQYVRTLITIRTRTMQANGTPVTRTLTSEIRVRNR